jgi:hypothetical protein
MGILIERVFYANGIYMSHLADCLYRMFIRHYLRGLN